MVAAVSTAYFAFVAFPFCVALGYIALLQTSRARSVRVPIGLALGGALGLAPPAIVYVGNEGNWNQPGTHWLVAPLLIGIVLLGANAFAIYVRYATSRLATFVGGPALLVACGVAFWWLLTVDSGRADSYMYRLFTVFACLYGVLGTLLVAERRWGR